MSKYKWTDSKPKKASIELARRVEAWGKRLAPLGVAHFQINHVTITDSVPGRTGGAVAGAAVSGSYDNVSFYFNCDWLEAVEEKELDETIIHEWLHVAMRDLDSVMEDVEQWMPPATYAMHDERVLHEKEGLIDRMSIALYALHTGEPVRFSP